MCKFFRIFFSIRKTNTQTLHLEWKWVRKKKCEEFSFFCGEKQPWDGSEVVEHDVNTALISHNKSMYTLIYGTVQQLPQKGREVFNHVNLPRAGSYNPPMVGSCKLSNSCGLVTSFTLSLKISASLYTLNPIWDRRSTMTPSCSILPATKRNWIITTIIIIIHTANRYYAVNPHDQS